MEQKKNNQERTRKYGGSSSYVDAGEPSKAPRQDEDGRESVGPSDVEPDHKYNSIGEQGISNRLAEDEHAFPESDEPQLTPKPLSAWRQHPSSRAEIAAGFEYTARYQALTMNNHEQTERRPEGKEGTGAHQEGANSVQAHSLIYSPE